MVALNFDRLRPDDDPQPERGRGAARLRARERHAAARRRAHVHRGDARARSRRRCRRSRRRRARSARRRSGTAARSAATSAPRRRRATRCRRSSSRARRSRSRARAAMRRVPLDEFLVGPKRNALAEDELIVGVSARAERPAADVHEGRPAERDGDRGLLARARRRPRARRDPRVLRLGVARVAARHRAARRGGRLPRARSPRPRPRSTTCAAPPRTGATRCACSRSARSRGASREDRAHRQRRAARGRRLGRARACSRRCATGSASPARRTRASRASAARARCSSTATLVCSCLVLAAQADGHEVVTVEGLADDGDLHPVQEAFAETGAVQCGFCTPGLVVATADLLRREPAIRPTTRSARRSPGTSAAAPGYQKILDAVHLAAGR